MSNRWALYIDIEGFGSKWSDVSIDAFRGINALMQGIYRIGERYFREPPDRLFAHQFGDAFLVVSDFHEPCLDRAALVATALLRHLLAHGETAKAVIAEGELAGIEGCYPPEIRKQLDRHHISIGSGVMTITPVLGSALINAVGVTKACSGPLLLLSSEHSQRLQLSVSMKPLHGNPHIVSVNWLRGEPAGLDLLQAATGFRGDAEDARAEQLSAYMSAASTLSDKWKDNAKFYLLES